MEEHDRTPQLRTGQDRWDKKEQDMIELDTTGQFRAVRLNIEQSKTAQCDRNGQESG